MSDLPGPRPRVLCVISGYPSYAFGAAGLLGAGGCEIQASRVAATLLPEVRTEVLTSRPPGLPLSECADGIPVTRIAMQADGTMAAVVDAVGILRAGLRLSRPDLIESFQLNGVTIAAAALSRVRRVPLIVKITGRGNIATILASTGGSYKLRFLLDSAAAIVAPSRTCLQDLTILPRAAAKLAYIPNGVDTDHFHPCTPQERATARLNLDLQDDDFVVCLVGRLRPDKGTDYAVNLWRRFSLVRPDARLLIAGDGPESDLIEQLVTDLPHAVRWLGSITDVRPVYAAADFNLLTSPSEGMSNVLLEAAASGIPSVVPAVEENLEVGGGHNFVVGYDRDSIESVVGVLDRLAGEDGSAGRGEEARRRAETEYSLTVTGERWIELYRRLIP